MIRFNPRKARGFSLMEMAVVLVIIAIILGAVTVGRDVYRSAVAERLGSEFVQGWLMAYDRYTAQVGAVPGDLLANPSGKINNALNTPLCGSNLRKAMLTYGVSLPSGRAEGFESHAVYQDAEGLPQDLEVCFENLGDWAEPNANSGYATRSRNVMVLSNVTPELARQLDARFDGRVDARFGRVRERNKHADVTPLSGTPVESPWSADDADRVNAKLDGQVKTMTVLIRMNQ